MTAVHQQPPLRRVRSASRIILIVLSGTFALGAFTQVFLAGLSIFDGPGHWADHVNLGHGLGLSARIIWIPAALGRVGMAGVMAAVMIAVLYQLQYALIEIDEPYVNALHPVNGVLMLILAIWLCAHVASRPWRSSRASDDTLESGSARVVAER